MEAFYVGRILYWYPYMIIRHCHVRNWLWVRWNLNLVDNLDSEMGIDKYYKSIWDVKVHTENDSVSKTLIIPCIEHHNFPFTLRSFVTGLVTVPIDRQCDRQVFQEVATK